MPDEEKKVSTDGSLTAGLLESILDRIELAKPDIQKWREEQRKEHEDNIIYVDGYVAILNIGANAMERWDGTNGYYELTPEQYAEWKLGIDPGFEPDESTYITIQGLYKRYRFPVIFNDLADPDECSYTIVQEGKSKLSLGKNMMSKEQSLELQMRRG